MTITIHNCTTDPPQDEARTVGNTTHHQSKFRQVLVFSPTCRPFIGLAAWHQSHGVETRPWYTAQGAIGNVAGLQWCDLDDVVALIYASSQGEP